MSGSPIAADAAAFAEAWIADWNSHDLDAILSHYSEDVSFSSPFAAALTGTGALEGQEALRAYWADGLRRRPSLKFKLLDHFEGFGAISILYSDEVGRKAVETMQFGACGKVDRASACYGPCA